MTFPQVKKVGITLEYYNRIMEGAKLGLFKVDDFLAYHFLSLKEIEKGVHLVCSIGTLSKPDGSLSIHLGDRDCFYSKKNAKEDNPQAAENIKKLVAQAAKDSEITGVINSQLPPQLLKNWEEAWELKTASVLDTDDYWKEDDDYK